VTRRQGVATCVMVCALTACGTPTSSPRLSQPASSSHAAPEPTLTMPATSALGSDVSDLPQRFPGGEWLPLETSILSMELVVKVVVNGRRVAAILDTGAMATTISSRLATRLGLLTSSTPRGAPVRAVDAHGDVIVGERIVIDGLELGTRRFDGLLITVLDQPTDLFLIGADILADLDLYIAADEGLVGLFPPGLAPHHVDELVVPVAADAGQLIAKATALGRGGAPVHFNLLVDSGAWNTSVPASVGINAGVSADLAYASTTVGVAGEQEARGRFVLDPLRLGPAHVSVGRVLALAATMDQGWGLGLLGNDVLMRFHSVISFRDQTLRLRPLTPRPSERRVGPGGIRCGPDGREPCVSVKLVTTTATPAPDDWPGVCLQVDVDRVYAGQTVELAMTAPDDATVSLLSGGAIRAYVSVDHNGAHHCFPLWPQLQRLGLHAESRLSLRWVRTEGVVWPCDPLRTRCVTFTGPLATWPVR
jgi:predicted aspartyl protease